MDVDLSHRANFLQHFFEGSVFFVQRDPLFETLLDAEFFLRAVASVGAMLAFATRGQVFPRVGVGEVHRMLVIDIRENRLLDIVKLLPRTILPY